MARPWLRAAFAGLLICLGQAPASAAPDDGLAGLLRLDEIIAVMRDEGLAGAADLDGTMLGGRGGDFWRAEAGRIYDPERMSQEVRQALSERLTDQQRTEILAFYDTERGRRILALETAARVAIADPAVEEAARARYAELRGSGDETLARISRFIEVNDLIERNVAGTTVSNLQFYRGMIEGGSKGMDEQTILDRVRAQQDELRRDTTGWVYGFLLMAYSPLSADDMSSYIAFSKSPAGQALNDALFVGFDTMFSNISFALGRGVARAMTASDL